MSEEEYRAQIQWISGKNTDTVSPDRNTSGTEGSEIFEWMSCSSRNNRNSGTDTGAYNVRFRKTL